MNENSSSSINLQYVISRNRNKPPSGKHKRKDYKFVMIVLNCLPYLETLGEKGID